MAAVEGYLHLPREVLAEEVPASYQLAGAPISLRSTPSFSVDSASYSSVTMNGDNLPKVPHSLLGADESKAKARLRRQVDLQYSRPSGPQEFTTLSENIGGHLAHVSAVNVLRESERLYLRPNNGYDLTAWETRYSQQPFFIKEISVSVEKIDWQAAGFGFEDVLAHFEMQQQLLQTLALRLPYTKRFPRRPGYTDAFLLLTDSILGSLHRAMLQKGRSE